MPYYLSPRNPRILQFSPQSLSPLAAHAAPLGSGDDDHPVRIFDDTTAESVQGVFVLPENCDSEKPLTMRVVAQPVTPADANVSYGFAVKALKHGGDLAGAFVAGDSELHGVDDTADRIFVHEQHYAGLGLEAGDLVFFRFARLNSGVTSNLSGDLRVYQLSFNIPVL